MSKPKDKPQHKPWGRSRGGSGGNDIRHWQCAACGKRSYRDRDAAKEAIRDMRRRGLARGAKIDPYLCHEGTGSWHVGHSSLYYEPPNLNDPHTYEVGGMSLDDFDRRPCTAAGRRVLEYVAKHGAATWDQLCGFTTIGLYRGQMRLVLNSLIARELIDFNADDKLDLTDLGRDVVSGERERRLRKAAQSGERNGNSRLTEDDVRAIRAAAQHERHIDIAARYGVSKSCIAAVVSRLTWADVR